MNKRIDVHVVATRKVTDRVSQEMNARSEILLDCIEDCREETEQSLKEIKENLSHL